MNRKVKLMPAVMTVLSAIYFVYVMMSEDTTLAADAVGGDPGGKILPMVMAAFMFAGFLYITWKERPDGTKMDATTKQLFLMTLVLSVLYVALIRLIGFVVLSTLLLYVLEYVFTTIDEARDKKEAILGGAGTVGATVAAYVVMRTITRSLMSLGRGGALPGIFTASTFQACISLIFVALLTIILGKTVCAGLKRKNRGRIANAGLLTMATVLFLYVVFKQFFNVNLAVGLLNF